MGPAMQIFKENLTCNKRSSHTHKKEGETRDRGGKRVLLVLARDVQASLDSVDFDWTSLLMDETGTN